MLVYYSQQHLPKEPEKGLFLGDLYQNSTQIGSLGTAVVKGRFIDGLGQGNFVALSQPINKLGSTQETVTHPAETLLTYTLFIIIIIAMNGNFARPFAMVMPGAASEMEGGRMALG